MRISRTDTVGGYPARKVRDYLRRYLRLFPEDAAKHFGISDSVAHCLLEQLVTDGYIEHDRSNTYDDEYRVTDLGARLQNASAAAPIRRATAERLLAELLDRIPLANASPDFCYTVREAIVFGSYLTSAERLSDIDLCVGLTHRELDLNAQADRERLRLEQLGREGRLPGYWFAQVSLPREEVLTYLKGRSTAISLHDAEQMRPVLAGQPQRRVFP